MKKKIVIILPAYNEEKSIFQVISSIPKISDFNQEVIVIDDGSIDNTQIMAKKAGATVISNDNNLGLGTSFKIGLKEALKHKADIIINLDADGQYDPHQIPFFVKELLKKDWDLVIGNRFLNDKELGHNAIKRWGNKFISIFISTVLARHNEIYDIQSGFRVLNRRCAEFLIKNLLGKYTYTQEMMILCFLYDFKIKQIPIKFYKRVAGKSRLITNPFIYLSKISLIALKTYIRHKILIIKKK